MGMGRAMAGSSGPSKGARGWLAGLGEREEQGGRGMGSWDRRTKEQCTTVQERVESSRGERERVEEKRQTEAEAVRGFKGSTPSLL